MSIFLVGGSEEGDLEELADVLSEFASEAAQVAVANGRPGAPVFAMVIVDGDDIEVGSVSDVRGGQLATRLFFFFPDGQPGAGIRSVLAPEGGQIDPQLLQDVDGIIVAGGLTPAYRTALQPAAEIIRELVGGGVPYLGFSAGAQLAAEQALIGGWQIGEVPVVAQRFSEGLDEVSVAQGLGLIDLTVDVHAAQWGTLTRLIASVEAGLVPAGVAIDENTALVIGQGALRVIGTGSVWRVQGTDNGVLVSSMGA